MLEGSVEKMIHYDLILKVKV